MFHKPLYASDGFTALLLFNLLRRPMNLFPDMISMAARTNVSYRRIIEFLTSKTVTGITNTTDGDDNTHNSNNNTIHKSNNNKISNLLPGQIINKTTSILVFENVTLAWNKQLQNTTTTTSPTTITTTTTATSTTATSISIWNKFKNIFTPSSVSVSTTTSSSSPHSLNTYHKHTRLATDDDDDFHDIDDITTVTNTFTNTNTPGTVTNPLHHHHPFNNNNNNKNNIHRANTITTDADILTDNNNATNATTATTTNNNENETSIVLENISFAVPENSLTVIVGSTGSGKSTLLSGILGECYRLQGNIQFPSKSISLSLATQSAWIQNNTLRENILFGSEYDPIRYQKVLFACALLEDIQQFPDGDLQDIGKINRQIS